MNVGRSERCGRRSASPQTCCETSLAIAMCVKRTLMWRRGLRLAAATCALLFLPGCFDFPLTRGGALGGVLAAVCVVVIVATRRRGP